MREINASEATCVSGGLFESLGNILDNPFTSIGSALDSFRGAVQDAIGGPIETGYYANGVYNIK